MHKSLHKFKPYVEKGLVREVISPCKRLVLYNYTDHCTYERAWDEVTLNARGTVYEIETGKIIAKAFPKFFNYGELSDKKKQEVLQSQDFEVFEKMDGSLGIVYYYDGEWRVNTRGSFTSDQAIKGKEMLDKKYRIPNMFKGCTFLVEIIYPENKIIVDYGKEEKLTLLSSFGKRQMELPYEYRGEIGFDLPERYNFNNIQSLMNHLETLDHTEEGYVVRLNDGYRVKFKSAEYLALARIMSNMSPLTFWSRMDEKGFIDRDFLEELPEEFREECDKIADELEAKYGELDQALFYEYSCVAIELRLEEGPTTENCKKLGLYINKGNTIHGSVLFNFLKQNERSGIHKYIMKKIRPTGNILKE